MDECAMKVASNIESNAFNSVEERQKIEEKLVGMLPIFTSRERIRLFMKLGWATLLTKEKLTQESLARITSVSKAAISQILNSWYNEEGLIEKGTMLNSNKRPVLYYKLSKKGLILFETLIKINK